MGNDHSRDADYHGAYPGNYSQRICAPSCKLKAQETEPLTNLRKEIGGVM
jgi:hypothetical protein